MAETIYVRGEGGAVIAMDLPLPDGIAQRYERGLLKRVNKDGSPFREPDPAPPTEPAKTASKAEWVGWAVAQGATPEDADGMTKADLIELYGTSTS